VLAFVLEFGSWVENVFIYVANVCNTNFIMFYPFAVLQLLIDERFEVFVFGLRFVISVWKWYSFISDGWFPSLNYIGMLCLLVLLTVELNIRRFASSKPSDLKPIKHASHSFILLFVFVAWGAFLFGIILDGFVYV
ncbi:41804_t:CDS:2, partial [Gigaspora margarita]